MDKNHKLHRYTHKDYSELVEFPVEIVGRDGIIRRYSFEDSIRLYQRRITFAPIRYRDAELVKAEVVHCRHRIDQLRRSFFYRFGWGTPEGEPNPEDTFGQFAGELAAFIRRVLRCDTRPDVRLEAVEERTDGVSMWLLIPAQHETGMLLYVYQFEEESTRETFFTSLKALERDEDGQQLVAFHHTADCGFILTGQAGEFDAIVNIANDDGIIRDITPTRWDRMIDRVRLGQYKDALATAQKILAEQPLHRRAYVVGSALASFLGQHLTAEEIATIGALYFPDDGDLHYWVGLSQYRQGLRSDAARSLQTSLDHRPRLAVARFLLVVCHLEQGRWFAAASALRAVPSVSHEDRRAARLLRHLHTWSRWCLLIGSMGMCVVPLGAIFMVVQGWQGLIPLAFGATMAIVAWLVFRHQLSVLTSQQRFDDVGLWVRRTGQQSPSNDPL
ncbi:MAG: tetratricopeptide (TPR) repeat protein [Kiritimatiellia bacterium]